MHIYSSRGDESVAGFVSLLLLFLSQRLLRNLAPLPENRKLNFLFFLVTLGLPIRLFDILLDFIGWFWRCIDLMVVAQIGPPP